METPHIVLVVNLLILSSSFLCFLPAAKAADSETDLSALLSFKSLISADPLGVLSSWNESLHHHCHWQGVKCGRRHSNRVTALVLDSKQLSGYISPSLANLTFLQKLSLSDNDLRGSIPVELGHLGRLRLLNLTLNFLDGSIPSILGNCSNLETLDLFYNNLHGSIPSSLMQCKQLKQINLRSNFLVGGIPPEFGLIPHLVLLVLAENNLTGSIPSTLGNLSSLLYLDLDQNDFNGYIPYSLGKLNDLSELLLGVNRLSGSIPTTLNNLTKLSALDLSQNILNGHIPLFLGNLTNLAYLSLHGNSFIGSIPQTLSNLKNITQLDLSDNKLSGLIPAALGKLQNLRFFSIFDNNVSGEIPHSLYNLSAMFDLELGSNRLEGTLPIDMCNVFPNLQRLHLYENQLKGQIPSSISNCSALTDVELDVNYFNGIIPSSIGTLQNLQYLTATSNQLEAKRPHDWSFIDALANCTSLQILDLAINQLQGVIPGSITNLSTGLLTLSLYNNLISGTIPKEIGRFTNLNTLQLGRMLLSGKIPPEIGHLFRLETLDLSYNMISGQIPSTFANLTQVVQLLLNNNSIEGSIPSELGNMQVLELLDFSNNKLTSEIPKEIFGLPSLSINLDLSHNFLTGILPQEIGNLKNLVVIRLSNNKLFGELPTTIGGCQVLQSLFLDSNLFQGTIPSSLSNLRGLQYLDVSNNSFSGQVPGFIGKMNLQYLNISFNKFEGELPKEGVFKNVSGLDVRGNSKLCGGVPALHLSQCITDAPPHRHHLRGNMVIIICFIVGAFICMILIGCFSITRYCKRRPQNNPQASVALKFKLKHVSYNDLLRATDNFSSTNLIGRGTFGVVYKAIMRFENVSMVAVKVLNLKQHGASRSFFSECEALRNVRHRNLIKVLSSCSSIDHQGNDFKALVFEFMPNGSLEAWLHPNACTNRPYRCLNIVQRLNIAIDVATALDYLHYHGPAPIVHCDLKPSNVLLDDDMTARVGDFGLARFLVRPDDIASQSATSTSGLKGSIGYIPPEYGMGGQSSVEGDMYSYGILLLEMFTGVSPTDERFTNGMTLHKYVDMAFPEHVTDIIDAKLFSEIDAEDDVYAPENVHGCLVSVIRCGLMCSKELPRERIATKDVVEELSSARKKLIWT